ncbi:MAG: CDP-diacylglycerol--serine O-phosphatidyltransferase [Rhodospirillales bacterium]|nr:CDP-diacylglycerol--serine O-phosphatidyltransferase [Rhodospirillales bacterium]
MARSDNNRPLRTRRLRDLTLEELIPNIITISGACAGLTAIRFAIEGRWEFAVAAILLAAFLDALDGTMARLLNATSDFGAQLDSLFDVLSFGVAPALVLYFWSLQDAGGLGWAIALLFVVCCGLRLARFNSMLGKMPQHSGGFFIGVPAPAGGLLALLPIVVWLDFDLAFASSAIVTGTWVILTAGLMVSQIPTYSFKGLRVPQPFVLPVLILAALFFTGLAGKTWITLIVVAALYVATFPLSARSFRRLAAKAAQQDNDNDDEPGRRDGDKASRSLKP